MFLQKVPHQSEKSVEKVPLDSHDTVKISSLHENQHLVHVLV